MQALLDMIVAATVPNVLRISVATRQRFWSSASLHTWISSRDELGVKSKSRATNLLIRRFYVSSVVMKQC